MKPRHLLLGLSLLGFLAVRAGDQDPIDPPKTETVGLVLHADNKKPLKNVQITAYLESKKEKTVQTDKAGNYSLDKLRPGTYKFVFEKAGFRRVTKSNVVIRDEESFQLNVEMIEHRQLDMPPSPLQFTDF